MNIKLPSVSIIIPSRNSGKTLERCLQSIQNLAYPPSLVETIVVDGGSTDNTVEIAKRFPTKILHEKGDGPTMARIIGLRQAKGEIIAFTDSDAILDTQWIRNAVEYLKQDPMIAVGGPLEASEQNSFAQALQCVFDLPGIARSHQRVSQQREVFMLPTANFLVRSEPLIGFKEQTWNGYGGDHMLSAYLRNQGYRLMLFPDVRVQHLKRSTPREALLELYLWGKGHPRRRPLILLPFDFFIPLTISYAAVAVVLARHVGFKLMILAMVPFVLEALWAGVRKKSWAVAAWSPVAFMCYCLGWSAGYLAKEMRNISLSKQAANNTHGREKSKTARP